MVVNQTRPAATTTMLTASAVGSSGVVKKSISVRPRPLQKSIQPQTSPQQQKQIIVIPGNMLLNAKGDVKSILKLASNNNLQQNVSKAIAITSTASAATSTSVSVQQVGGTKVVLPTLVKTATTATPITSIRAATTPIKSQVVNLSVASLQQHQQLQPRVISLKRPYTSIKAASATTSADNHQIKFENVHEPSVIRLSSSSLEVRSIKYYNIRILTESSMMNHQQNDDLYNLLNVQKYSNMQDGL